MGLASQRVVAVQRYLEIVTDSVSNLGANDGRSYHGDEAAPPPANQLQPDPQLIAALVSHELREPVNAIQSFLNVVIHERTGPLTDLQSEFLSSAQTSARRLARRINDVQVALAGGAALNLDWIEIDLNERVSQCCQELAWAVERYGISLQLQLEQTEEETVCWGDPDRIDQILLNLIENAIRYAPSEGEVSIFTRRDRPDRWTVIVENSEDVPLASDPATWFQPYERGERAHSPQRSGLGLGLTIAHYLARAHRGDITAGIVDGRVRLELVLPCHPKGADAERPAGKLATC